MLSPGYPRPGELYGHAVAAQVAALARQHELRVQPLSPRPGVGDGGGGAPRLFEAPRGGQARRFATVLARHAAWRPALIWGLWLDRAGPAACALGRLLGCPALVSVMGGELARLPELGYGGRRTAAGRAKVQAVLRAASALTVGSAPLAGQVRALAPRARAYVTPIGVAPEGIPVRAAPPWRPGSRLEVAAVVDVAPVKGADRIFGTVATLARGGVDVRLTLFTLATPAGRAALEAQARAAGVEAQVILPPAIPSPELHRRLPEFHVLLSASAHESQGLALIEAALAQVPVVAPAVGVAEALAGLGALTLSPSREPADLAPRVLQAASRPVAARGAVAAAFGLEAATQAFLRVFEEVAG